MDNRYLMQEKKDGVRRLIKKVGNQIAGINRKGLAVELPEIIVRDLQQLPGDCILDCEQVGNMLYIFDVLETGTEDLRSKPCEDRSFVADSLCGVPENIEVRPAGTERVPRTKQTRAV